MVLPLPGAPVVRVSEHEDPELFKASLCGLGATGMMVEVEVEVEPAFRLKEVKTAVSVDHFLGHFDSIRRSAEHVRVWWYPDGHGMVVGRANRTYGVSLPCASPIDLNTYILVALTTRFVASSPDTRLPRHPILPPHRTVYSLPHALGREMGMVVIKDRVGGNRRWVQGTQL